MSPKLRLDNQLDRLCYKASQKLGMLRRNCFFVRDKRRARTLYLVIVRSLFQHCSIIWRPTNLRGGAPKLTSYVHLARLVVNCLTSKYSKSVEKSKI